MLADFGGTLGVMYNAKISSLLKDATAEDSNTTNIAMTNSFGLGDGQAEDFRTILLSILGSFLLWLDLYAILCSLYPHCSYEWNCRVLTTVHACVSSSLCFLSAFILGPWPLSYIGHENNPLHNSIILFSLGYFIFDFAWCVYMWTEGPVMLAHHCLSIFGFCYVTYYNRYGCEITALLGGSEFTNPLLQLRWFLKQTGLYSGTKEILLDYSFVFFFLTARVGVGTVFLGIFLISPRVDWVAMVGGTGFYLISFIFGLQLVQFLRRKYVQRRPTKGD